MFSRGQRLLEGVLIGLLVASLPATVAAKSYYHPEIVTTVLLQPNGDVRILQERTYSFAGTFSWADIDLRKQGAADVILQRLAEYTGSGWRDIEPTELRSDERSLYVRWSYSAQDEEKRFLLDYTIKGAIRRYQDVAEFYWKVIEDNHARIESIVIRLVPPAASPSLFKVYVHSAATPGRLVFTTDFDTAVVHQRSIAKDRFVEIRVLTESGLYPLAAQLRDSAYERILKEERENFLKANLRRHFLIPIAIVLLVVVPLLLLLTMHRRFGREPQLSYEAIYEHEPPRKVPPVMVPLILHQRPSKSAMYQPLFGGMMATLLAMARRGAVTVQEVRERDRTSHLFRLVRSDVVANGDDFDKACVSFFFDNIGKGTGSFDEKMVKEFVKDNPTVVRSFLGDVFDAAMLRWRAELGGGFVERASVTASGWYVVITALSSLLGALALANGLAAIVGLPDKAMLPVALSVAAVLAFVFAGLGSSIVRWTPAAYIEHRRWKNFRKFLVDFSAIEQAPVTLLGIWEEYYVFAVALGVADRFLKHVARLAAERGAALSQPAWYLAAAAPGGAGMASIGEGLSNFAAFASNLSGMIGSFSTATSSGGGFSGGGGGGGGGGSSSAG